MLGSHLSERRFVRVRLEFALNCPDCVLMNSIADPVGSCHTNSCYNSTARPISNRFVVMLPVEVGKSRTVGSAVPKFDNLAAVLSSERSKLTAVDSFG